MTAANLARREAERDRREKERAERALARDAENEARRVAREEIREREATAKKLAADSEKQRLENERFAKRVAEENKAWEEARQRARAVVAKQREAEEPVKAVAESRRQRDEAESRTQRRADTIAKWSNRAGDAAQYLGRAAGGMAGNDARPALVGAVDAATAGLSRLGPYGMAAGQALQAVAKVGTAASETVDAFVKRGRELSSYNGQLAGASATADLRSMMADIREANDLGPQMSQLIEQQSKNDAVMREIMLPIKSFLIDEVKDFMTGLMVVASSGLEGFNELLDTFHVKSDAIEKALGKIKDVLADRDLDGDPMRIWRDAAARMEFAPPAPVPGGGPLGVPLIVRKP